MKFMVIMVWTIILEEWEKDEGFGNEIDVTCKGGWERCITMTILIFIYEHFYMHEDPIILYTTFNKIVWKTNFEND